MMPKIEEQIEIAAARADVFRFSHDIASWPDWNEQVVAVELLTSSPIRSGTLIRIDADAGGSVFSWDAEYIGYQMPAGSKLRVLDAASSSPFGKGSQLTWQLESIGSGTRFIWSWNYQPHGFLASIADKLGKRAATQRAIKRSLENLKNLIESGRRARIS
jgi:uncharacterized membrane protein